MTEQKRPVGRPRKIPVSAIVEKDGRQFVSLEDAAKLLGIKPEEEPTKNPDCEPATRGYVKCLLRKNLEHKHEQNTSGDLSIVVAAFGWVATTLAWSLSCLSNVSPSLLTVLDAWSVPLSLFSVAMTVVAFDMGYIGVSLTTSVEGECPKEIQKWQLPTCEKKKDCEE
jgi:hypothetical protein